jgi:hypothetical protein
VPSPDPAPGGSSSGSQELTAVVPRGAGGLILSIEPEDREVQLSTATLTADQEWVATGSLNPVKVSDTRESAPGWQVSGRITQVTGPDGPVAQATVGWTPQILENPSTGAIQAGAGLAAVGAGLKKPATLASAPAGKGRGTTVLGAGLKASFPSEALPGTYRTTLTLTVI